VTTRLHVLRIHSRLQVDATKVSYRQLAPTLNVNWPSGTTQQQVILSCLSCDVCLFDLVASDTTVLMGTGTGFLFPPPAKKTLRRVRE